ncbi:MRGX1 protein, partial [Penelope pileata]|nr:MRGX1 protein [Penelope pileata]
QPSSNGGDYEGTHCDGDSWSHVPTTLLTCLGGLLGNGAVLGLLFPHARSSPVAVCTLNLAAADVAFLSSTTIALGMFSGPQSLCHRLGTRGAMTALNVAIIFTFTASSSLLAALGASTALPCCHPHRPWLPCALLWLLALLLALTLPFSPAVLLLFILTYLCSLLLLLLSALTLCVRAWCCSLHPPLRGPCAVVLLAAASFPFLTADFAYWLLVRLFDISVVAFDTSLLLACLHSSLRPAILLLAGCWAQGCGGSARAACLGAIGDPTEVESGEEAPRESTEE